MRIPQLTVVILLAYGALAAPATSTEGGSSLGLSARVIPAPEDLDSCAGEGSDVAQVTAPDLGTTPSSFTPPGHKPGHGHGCGGNEDDGGHDGGHDGSGGHSGSKGYKNAVYFTNWGVYGADYHPQDLPADDITHVLYSFANIAPDGEVFSTDPYSDVERRYTEATESPDTWNDVAGETNAYGCIKRLFLLKKKHRHLKVLLSIGGWTYSPNFAAPAATPEGRKKFASSAVKLMADWGMDGLDIDWEYPADAVQAQNYVELLKACRDELDAYAKHNAPDYHFIITVASPAGAENYNVLKMEAMDPLLDGWHLMAYDYAGVWDNTSGHQAALFFNSENPMSTKFNTWDAVKAYTKRKVPAEKIVMGLPLYGRSFLNTAGVGQSSSSDVGPGSIEEGVWLYKDLPRQGAEIKWDGVAVAAYSYDAATKELVTFDTVESAGKKADWLMEKKLGGAVFWEASGDKTGKDSLVGTLAGKMKGLDRSKNLLNYPASQYANIKNGMK